jgi:hypothetical protein
MMVMEMGSAKLLDEACNHYNEVYRDEALYAAWDEAPQLDAVVPARSASMTGWPAFPPASNRPVC